MAARICPECRTDLKLYKQGNVELDYCSLCGGVYLDKGELNHLIAALKSGIIAKRRQNAIVPPPVQP